MSSITRKVVLGVVLALLTSPHGSSQDVRDLAGKARIGLVEAIGIALKARPGKAVEAELETARVKGQRSVVIEVDIVTAESELHEVTVDATSGKVVGQEKCDDSDDRAELKAFRRALRHAELDLARLIESAGRVIKGTAVEATLELEDGQPVCEVSFVNSRYLIEVEVEARAGHLVEIELEGAEDEDDDEEEGEKETKGKKEHREGGDHDDEDGDEDGLTAKRVGARRGARQSVRFVPVIR